MPASQLRPDGRLALLGRTLILLAASILGAGAPAGAESASRAGSRIVRVGYYDAKPSCYRDERGRPRGIFIEVLDAIAARSGWTVEYSFEGWDELLAALRAGTIDLVPANVKTAQRESFAAFTSESVMTDWGAVFARTDRAPSSIVDLGGRTVGALENDFWFSGQGSLKELCAAFGVHPDYRYYPDYSTLFAALGRGELQAAVGSNSLGIVWAPELPIASTSILYNPIELRFAASRASGGGGPELAADVDEALARLRRDSPELLSSILADYQMPLRREFKTPLWLFLVSLGTGIVLLAVVILLAIQRRARRRGEERLSGLFEESPISLWEEDFSAVKRRVDEARSAGEGDWDAYFGAPGRVEELASLVRVLDVNKAALGLLGYGAKAEALDFLPGAAGLENLEPLRAEFTALAGGATSVEGEAVHVARDGRKIDVHYKLIVMPGSEQSWSRVLVSLVDLSERKKAEEELVRSLAEKGLLLQEVHHRVKNNLQVICSLISLQMNAGKRPAAENRLLVDIEARVRAMSLVHETLYRSDDFSSVEFSTYIGSLCDHLLEAYSADRGAVALKTSLEELSLPLEKAIPCGLIVNELVVNSLKHAFPGGRRGTIEVSLSKTAEGSASLIVRDDGAGMPEAEGEAGATIGMNLVRTLVSQLGGSFEASGGTGTTTRITFHA
jgi:two-component sensor histidine kinase/ABC-type amino acid transport substrate-binding protein